MPAQTPSLQPPPPAPTALTEPDSARSVFGSEEVEIENTIHFIGGETLDVNLSAEMIEQQVNAQPSSSLCVLRNAIRGERDVRLNARNITFISEKRPIGTAL